MGKRGLPLAGGEHGPMANQVMDRLDRMAAISSSAKGLTRLYLSPEHKAAAELVRAWMSEAGLKAAIDAIGNVVGRYEAAGPGAKTLILGSHIDTVQNAGRFDGNLGVVLAIQAVAVLAARNERLPFAIEVVAFGDEEGVRFPVALSGSRALAGILEPAALDSVDDHGILLRDALRSFGCNPDEVGTLARRADDVLGYLEVHIEQGPVLDTENLPVGVVTAIAGASRLKITVQGVAGHAGTVPMHLRQDAFAAVAAMVSMVERVALETADLVATVGRVEVLPGTVNVIPARASFTIDIRSPFDAVRRDAVARLSSLFAEVAAARNVGVDITTYYQAAAAPCGPMFQDALAAAIERQGLPVLSLPSGAGHDGLAMVHLCPIGMLFVRCAGGISHNPAEAIEAADAETALLVLLDALRILGVEVAARGRMPNPAREDKP